MYIITNLENGLVQLQKINGKLFLSRKYDVPLTHVFPVSPGTGEDKVNFEWDNVACDIEEESDSDVELDNVERSLNADEIQGVEEQRVEHPAVELSAESADAAIEPPVRPPSTRVTRRPQWQKDYDCS